MYSAGLHLWHLDRLWEMLANITKTVNFNNAKKQDLHKNKKFGDGQNIVIKAKIIKKKILHS